MRIFFFLTLVCCTHILHSQTPLSNSLRTSVYKYVYKITAEEAETLFKKGEVKELEPYLHSLLDSIPIKDPVQYAGPGNYLSLFASNNTIKYEVLSQGNLNWESLDNGRDLGLLLYNNAGQIIEGAEVKWRGKKVLFDISSKTYRLKNASRKNKDLIVYYQNTVFYIPLQLKRAYSRPFFSKIASSFPIKQIKNLFAAKREDYYYFFQHETPYEKGYRGYMAFNKPNYKPGDSVQLKAYILDKRGRGIDRKLIVRLTDATLLIDTVLAVISPTYPGSYTFDFKLTESLDLDLDDTYLITLEEERSRKYDLEEYEGDLDDDEFARQRLVLMRGKFMHEEYELNSLSFELRADEKQHYRGSPLALYFKGRDDNNLPVMDGRVQLTVLTPTYADPRFQDSLVFLPDTLWKNDLSLEAVGETKLILPDSIFPKASFNYQVMATLLTSNNERREQQLYLKFINDSSRIIISERKDSLVITYKRRDTEHLVDSVIMVQYRKGGNDSSYISLPARVKIDPFVRGYSFIKGLQKEDHYVRTALPKVVVTTARTPDSVFFQIRNPLELNGWYTLFAGNKIIEQGKVESSDHLLPTKTRKNYFLVVEYLYGGEIKKANYNLPFQDKLLNVSQIAPLSIYPGQESELVIQVNDQWGKPVEDADVTAFAFTSKFKEYPNHQISYLGKIYPYPKMKKPYTTSNKAKFLSLQMEMVWERWSQQMGLDTNEYFKFLFTDTIYYNWEKVEAGPTQIAPFVIDNGKVLPIHSILIDERPVYFSQSQHISGYSFPITAGKHSLRLRTANNSLFIREVVVKEGMKTIVAFPIHTAVETVHISKKPDTLTLEEKQLMQRYSILIQNLYSGRYVHVNQEDRFFLLPQNHYGQQGGTLIGPLMPTSADLEVHERFSEGFPVEGGYEYWIEEGYIRQKESPFFRNRFFLSNTPMNPSFTDLVMTADAIDKKWQEYLVSRSQTIDLFPKPYSSNRGKGSLEIGFELDSLNQFHLIKNIFLFRADNSDYMKVIPGNNRNLGFLDPGYYRLYILLRDNKTLFKDSLYVRPGGITYYRFSSHHSIVKDHTGDKLWEIIRQVDPYGIRSNQQENLLRESFNRTYLDPKSLTTNVNGRVVDDKGNPVPFATIMIKGTIYSTSADANGYYSLQTPSKGTLEISAAGFSRSELSIGSSQLSEVRLTQSNHSLEEVVVTGFSRKRKAEIGYSTTTVSGNFLAGKVSGLTITNQDLGIHIRGVASVNGLNKPLIIIDGVVQQGDGDGILDKYDPSEIGQVTVLKSEAAASLYGSQGINGAIVITTQKAMLRMQELGESGMGGLRKNFKDHAYWQPSLRTGKDGSVKFKVKFPDDITNWKTYAIAGASSNRIGYFESSIKSFKPLGANLALPQFALEGDSINVIGKILNYGTEPVLVRKGFIMDSSEFRFDTIRVRNSFIDTLQISAGFKDSLKIQFSYEREDGYRDGEERTIPVFKKGVVETIGFFAALDKDTSFKISLNDSSRRIKIYAESSLLPVLLEEAKQVIEYEYLCNEQLASKLKALLSLKKATELLGEKFKKDKVVEQLISSLNSNRDGQLWGWWKGSRGEIWISLHVIEALILAEKEKYKINLPRAPLVAQLVYELETKGGQDKILMLKLLQLLGEKVDFSRYIHNIESSYIKKPGLYESLRLFEVKQSAGLKIPVDSLVLLNKRTLFGNIYWGEETFSFFDNSIQNTVLMYRILKRQGGYEEMLSKIRHYFLEKRRSGSWRNTYESTLILETILPDLFEGGIKPSNASITVNVDGGVQKIEKFPFSMEIDPGSNVSITKEGGMPVYFTAYQQQWNKQPERVKGAFEVSSSFIGSSVSGTRLRAGEAIELKVEVKVTGDADYVMIEVPIPAGCSYASKPQPRWSNEVHREYFKEKVSIFCRSLKQGTYSFTIPLLPRYSGNYSLNPAKAEMMYFPVFYGREGMKEVRIR